MQKTKQKQSTSGDLKVYRGLRQIAKAAGVSRPTLARHLDKLEHRRLDGVILVTQGALERWLEGHDTQEAV